ncbi:MAG: zf-HC2 domain-containing protein [Methylohalobius sp.]
MTNEKTAWIEDERLVVLLGLAAGKPQPEDQCPPAEQFSAFIDGRLSSPERKRIIAHLNSCEQCYQAWLEAALVLSEMQPKSQKQSWWHKLQALWRTRPWMIPLTAALAMSLAVLAIVIQKPSQETWQISQLAAMVRNHPGLDQALAALPQDLGNLNFAFSDTPQNLAKQAFTAGFRQAWSWFDGADSPESSKAWPQRSPWRDYYDLGQWAFLTWLLAQTEGVSAEEWQVFERHCQNLIARFEQQPEGPTTDQVLASLREIHPMLGTLARQPDFAQQVRLGRRLRLTIQQFLS